MRSQHLAAAFLALPAIAAFPAHAQIFRAYLTLDGNDANPCTLSQPCRLLPAALTAVQAAARSGCSIRPTTTRGRSPSPRR